MAYRWTTFNGVALPIYDAQRNQHAGPVDSGLLDSIGGAFDYHGSNRRLPRRQQFDMRGRYLGETRYLTDESGNFQVDENGNFQIAGDGANHLRGQIDELKAQIGVRGNLVRVRLDDESVSQTKLCRLLDVQHAQIVDERDTLAEIACIFETTQIAWKSSTQSSISKSLTNGTFQIFNARNGGGIPIYDAVLTITRTSGTITAIAIEGSGIDIDWTGSLGASGVLIIDAGDQTVEENGADAYSGFSFGANHTVDGFFPLEIGLNNISVTLTGGGATVALTWYEQWP